MPSKYRWGAFALTFSSVALAHDESFAIGMVSAPAAFLVHLVVQIFSRDPSEKRAGLFRRLLMELFRILGVPAAAILSVVLLQDYLPKMVDLYSGALLSGLFCIAFIFPDGTRSLKRWLIVSLPFPVSFQVIWIVFSYQYFGKWFEFR